MNHDKKKKIIQSPFEAPWWFRNAHFQTLYSTLSWGRPSSLKIKREILDLPDGDITAVDWVQNIELNESTPLLIILHGLEGSSESSYVKMLMEEAFKKKWQCCVLHFRDCGNCENKHPRRYHAGDTEDIKYFIEYLKSKKNSINSKAPLLAAGYSLGGNVLLKYLGENRSKAPLRAAVAVSTPLNLHISSDTLKSFKSCIYQRYLVNKLKKSVYKKFGKSTTYFNLNKLRKAKTFYEFDDLITSRLHGFNNANDYYSKCSSTNYLRYIDCPTLIINALDDPFMRPEGIPAINKLSDNIILEVSKNGGHVGFIEGGTLRKPRFYLPKRIISFMESLIS